MKFPPPKDGDLYSAPDFVGDANNRFFIILNVFPDGMALIATLTSDSYDMLSPHQGFQLLDLVPSIYRGPENRKGIPPRPGKLSLKNFKDDTDAIIKVEIFPHTGTMYIESHKTIVKPDYMNTPIEIDYRTSTSEVDFPKIVNSAVKINAENSQIFNPKYTL